MRKILQYSLIGLLIILLAGAGFVVAQAYLNKNVDKEKFESDVLFLKIAISENGSAVNNIKIKNTDNIKQSFSIEVKEVEKSVSLDNYKFELNSMEEKIIQVKFKANEETPGVYLGKLVISSNKGSKEIPVILEIESRDVLFDSNVVLFPQGKDIVLGQNLDAEIKIYDLAGVGRSNVNLSYYVKDFDEGLIFSESETLVVDGKLDYSKVIDMGNAKAESYVLVTAVQYGESIGISTLYFKVFENASEIYSEKGIIWIIAIFVFFFFVFLALFVYSLSYRDKLLKELQSQYKREIRRQDEIIRFRQKQDLRKLKGSFEKRIYKKELERVKKQRIKVLGEIHKKKLKEYKKIKKKYKGNKLNEQLNKWKKQGYNTEILEKYKMPGVNEIRKKIQEWKKKGYDTSVLER